MRHPSQGVSPIPSAGDMQVDPCAVGNGFWHDANLPPIPPASISTFALRAPNA
jgi:hypothetical protein